MKLNKSGFITDAASQYKIMGHWFSPWKGLTGSYRISVKGVLSFCVPQYSVDFADKLGQIKISKYHHFFVIFNKKWARAIFQHNQEWGTSYKERMWLDALDLMFLINRIQKLKNQENVISKRVTSTFAYLSILEDIHTKIWDALVNLPCNVVNYKIFKVPR